MVLTVRDFLDLSPEKPVHDNPFSALGEEQAPAGKGDPANRFARKHEADLSPLEKKLREKQRLTKAYLASQRERRAQALADEPRLRDFTRYLRTIPACGDDLPSILKGSWLPASPKSVRLMALELVNRRCDQINRSLGFVPLDDPLPPSLGGYDDTRTRAARILYPNGRE